METDINENRGAFPADQPLQALRRDHDLVRRLARAWRDSGDEQVRTQAAKQLVMLLEVHSKLEEGVFYPAVRTVDAALIETFEQVHHEADDLIEALKSSSLEGDRPAAMIDELLHAVLQHIEAEETQLFPKLERAANLDMEAIGLQMQASEASLVHTQTQPGQQGKWR